VQRALGALDDRPLDVLVVGGGIHGAWAARSAARRGLDVGLAEAVDFASGTSSRSTMLAHGGLRYLAQYDVGLVREALVERGALIRRAGHLVRPIPFLLPFYEEAPYPKWQLKLGLRLYTLLARGSGYPRHEFLSKRQVLELEPGLREEGLTGGAVYYDGQILSPERLTASVARDAAGHGARLANHARVTDLEPEGEGVVAEVEDQVGGGTRQVRARSVANTTGPFLDRLLEDVGLDDDMLRLTKGIHLATPPFTEHAVVVNARDGRTFFAVPWHGHQVVGTTDTDYHEDPREVHATREDVSYLQDSLRSYFPDAPVDEVRFTWAGLRNLLNVEGKHPSDVTRAAKTYDHADQGLGTVVSLVGGKLTTARATSRELVDELAVHVGGAREPEDQAPLPGGAVDLRRAYRQARRVTRARGLDDRVAQRLVRLFGSDWARVAGAGLEPLDEAAGVLRGEAVFAAEREAALTVADVLRRRTLAWAAPGQGARAADAVEDVLVASGAPESAARGSATGYRQALARHDRWRARVG
jgi:glycerol-3-phosphate dehydrogenase